MRILHVIDSMDPARGGPVESICQNAAVMKDDGHLSEVVSLDSLDAPWNAAVPLTHHPQSRKTRRYGYSPQFTRWMSARHSDYDAVVIHGIWTYATLGAWRALSGGQTPYVVFTHGMLDPWFGKARPVKNIAKQLYWMLALGRVLADAQAVLFTTAEEERLARTAFHGYRYKPQVVAYGTADIPGDKQTQIAAFYAALPTLEHRKFLLFLGRIHPKKGCDLLIHAFAHHAESHPHLDLVIAGPDQVGWAGRLQQLALELGVSSRIHWPGMLSGDLKWGAFHAAEAFILPSHQENFGIAVAEAMACAKPVLVSDKVNIWPDIIQTGAGLVASDDLTGTDDLFARYFSRSLAEVKAMGEAGRQCFLERFRIENAAHDLVSTLQDLISSTRPISSPVKR